MFVYKFRQWSKFLRELFFSRELFSRIVKKTVKIPKIWIRKKLVPHGMSAHATFLAFWQFATWLVTQDFHKSHNGIIFSNKARLLLDYSRVFQNVSLCEIRRKIKQLIYIFVWIRELPRSSSMMSRKKKTYVTLKIGYSLLVQTLQN